MFILSIFFFHIHFSLSLFWKMMEKITHLLVLILRFSLMDMDNGLWFVATSKCFMLILFFPWHNMHSVAFVSISKPPASFFSNKLINLYDPIHGEHTLRLHLYSCIIQYSESIYGQKYLTILRPHRLVFQMKTTTYFHTFHLI